MKLRQSSTAMDYIQQWSPLRNVTLLIKQTAQPVANKKTTTDIFSIALFTEMTHTSDSMTSRIPVELHTS